MDLRAYKITRDLSQVAAAPVPAVFVVAPAPPPPQPLPAILVLPPQPAPTIVRPSLGVSPSPFRQGLSSSSRLARSPYRQLSVAPGSAPPPPPPPPPAPAPAPVLAAPASTASGMPQQYMQPLGFYLPSHARHAHHAAIRPELAARVSFRRGMEAADAVFQKTTKEAVEAIDRAMGQQ